MSLGNVLLPYPCLVGHYIFYIAEYQWMHLITTNLLGYSNNKLVVLLFFSCCLQDSDDILQEIEASTKEAIRSQQSPILFVILSDLQIFHFSSDYPAVYVILKINLNFVLLVIFVVQFCNIACRKMIVTCFYSSKLRAPPRKFLR